MNSAIISRPPGPRSRRGKAKSSANRTQHGLRGQGLLLPGESEEEYQEHLQGWLDSLHATNYAETRLIAELADLAWRLARIRRVEHAAVLRNVEKIVMNSPRYRSFTGLAQAADGLDALIGALVFGKTRDPFPNDPEAIRPLIAGAKGVLNMLDDVGPVMAEHEYMADKILALEIAAAAGTARPELLAPILEAATVAREKVRASMADMKRELEEMKDRALTETPLPGDTDGKKLARYRAQIENSMSRTLDILGKTKTVSKKSRKKSNGKGGSFGSGNSPVVRLRVIR